MIIEKTCIFCGKTKEIHVNQQAYEKWQEGALIQNAMPDLPIGDREMLISSICEPCFDETVGEG